MNAPSRLDLSLSAPLPCGHSFFAEVTISQPRLHAVGHASVHVSLDMDAVDRFQRIHDGELPCPSCLTEGVAA